MFARTIGGKRVCQPRAVRGDAARGSRPSIASIRGRRNSAAQASAEAGLPGSPSTRPCPAAPNQVGLPGRTAIFSTASFKPQPHQSGPRMIMIADRGAADHHQQIAVAQTVLRRARDGADIVSFHRQAIGRAAPGLDQARDAERAGIEYLIGIRAREPGAASSSPLLRMAMRGARTTGTCAMPDAAASDSAMPSSLRPAASKSVPAEKSQPRGRIFFPAAAAGTVMLSPSRRTSSWMTTVSAPSGIAAPVEMRIAVPASQRPSKPRPAADSPINRKVPGVSPLRTA